MEIEKYETKHYVLYITHNPMFPQHLEELLDKGLKFHSSVSFYEMTGNTTFYYYFTKFTAEDWRKHHEEKE